MKRILITGANGQLGRSLKAVLDQRPDYNYVATDVVADAENDVIKLDLINLDEVSVIIDQGFDFVVNCAAYTAVDKAEEEPELCRLVNTDAVANIALSAKRCGTKVIHVSTDYVFSGEGHLPYKEEDSVNPQSVYGQTKLQGELLLRNQMLESDYAIIRTAWLYSPYGHNFVKTMLRLGSEKDSLNVVADQIGSPTYAPDLAYAIVDIMDAEKFVGGIYHFTNEGVASWFDFAVNIMQLANITDCKMNPCTSKEFPQKAHRPYYSVLSKQKIRNTYSLEIPYWRDSLSKCIKILKDNGFTY